jgi:anti-sigma B factor antagonist
MNAQNRFVGPVAVLTLAGRFDRTSAPKAADWLLQVSNTRPARVIVDLSEVTFVDSTAIATLVRALKRCRQNGGDLYLCGLRRQVYMIFELTRLDQAFSLFENELHALQAFQAEPPGEVDGAFTTAH